MTGGRRRPLPAWFSGRVAAGLAVAVVVLAVLPVALDPYTHNLLTLTFLAISGALAWNWMGGYLGQVSFGHAAFFGFGGFVAARVLLHESIPPWVAWAAGAAAAGLFSVGAYPILRLRGPYFSIATIGVGEAVRVIASGVEFTGGSSGLRMPSGGFNFISNYYGMAVLALFTVAVVFFIHHDAFGLALDAIRQDIDAAEALGVQSTRYKLLAHAVSAALVGAAGGLFAMNFQYISPGSVFDFRLSLSIVLMPIVGGIATLVGPVLGAVLFSYLQIKLLASPALRDSYLFIYGGLLMAVMLFEPRGMVGLWERLVRLRSRQRPQAAEA